MTKPLPPEMRKRSPDRVDWSEWRLAMLRRMWPDSGIGCPEIALAIGCGATRNAIIGKARRLGLGPKPLISGQSHQARGGATKRAKSEQQRVVSMQALAERRKAISSPQALAEHREKQAAAGPAAIAAVELALINNPRFVARVEKPADLYAHMRSDKGYQDALAALSRDRKTGEIFHGRA